MRLENENKHEHSVYLLKTLPSRFIPVFLFFWSLNSSSLASNHHIPSSFFLLLPFHFSFSFSQNHRPSPILLCSPFFFSLSSPLLFKSPLCPLFLPNFNIVLFLTTQLDFSLFSSSKSSLFRSRIASTVLLLFQPPPVLPFSFTSFLCVVTLTSDMINQPSSFRLTSLPFHLRFSAVRLPRTLFCHCRCSENI